MSRSRKRIPIFGHCGGSQKDYKRFINRMFRKKVSDLIAKHDYDKLPYKVREIMDIWSMPCDGKFYWDDASNKDLRK